MSETKTKLCFITEELASSFETQATATDTSDQKKTLPSPLTLYRTGRVLYLSHENSSGGGSNDRQGNSALTAAFEDMICTLPEKYVHHTLLHDLHHAYASLIVSFTASASTTTPAISALRAMIGNSATAVASWKDVLEGTESICGLYLSSLTACRCCSISSEEGRRELELIFVSLSWFYDYSSKKKNTTDAVVAELPQKYILTTLSRLLINGIVPSLEKNEVDTLGDIMTLIQNIQSATGEYLCALGDMLVMEEEKNAEQSLVAAIRSKFQAQGALQPPQLQYLLAMLRASPKSNAKKEPPSIVNTAPASQGEINSHPEPQKTMTDIQIEHIKRILPTLGEGYIEEALKCYNNDLERTLEALFQVAENGETSNIHPRLFTLPTNLPRKLRSRVNQYTANVNLHRGATAKDDGKEHVKIQKEHIKQVERHAEEEAFLIENVSRTLGGLKMTPEEDALNSGQYGLKSNRNEYNDDYDDQYDGIGGDGGMGGLDDGLYDVDIHNVHQKHDRMSSSNEQEMWKKYNNLIKGVEEESKYWEGNKNLNHAEKDAQSDKKYRGPDKGKKGRVIGPDGKYLPIKHGGKKGRGGGAGGSGGGDNSKTGQGAGRGGKGGRGSGGRGGRGGSGSKKDGNNAGDGELSKIQKRRKNDNKAKLGNHHRKDRATKKASGGMVM